MERMLNPVEVSDKIVESSIKKTQISFIKTVLLGIMAGIFIAIGSVGAMTIWGLEGDAILKKYLGAAVFPVGIILVVAAGSELFTGNSVMTISLLKKKITFGGMMKNWVAAYIGNLIGSLFMVFLIYKAEMWVGTPTIDTAINIAIKKTSLSFSVLLYRAILCNIIVVLAVWISAASSTMMGKIASLWFPISVFVISGYEHSIANMFFIPVAMIHGANITVFDFLSNLIPVTIGNMIGGGIIIPFMYYIINYSKRLN